MVVSLKMSAELKEKLCSYARKRHHTVSSAGVNLLTQCLSPVATHAREHPHRRSAEHIHRHDIEDLGYDLEHGLEYLGPEQPPSPHVAELPGFQGASS